MPNRLRQRDVSVPHFRVPFQFGGMGGGAFMNEQDSEDDIVDCIKTIIAFPIDSLISQPGFGRPDIVFKERHSGQVPEEIKSAILEWEDRTTVDLKEGGLPFPDQLVLDLLLKVGASNA